MIVVEHPDRCCGGSVNTPCRLAFQEVESDQQPLRRRHVVTAVPEFEVTVERGSGEIGDDRAAIHMHRGGTVPDRFSLRDGQPGHDA